MKKITMKKITMKKITMKKMKFLIKLSPGIPGV